MCKVCSAIYVVRDLWCTLYGTSYVVYAAWYKLCDAGYLVEDWLRKLHGVIYAVVTYVV